MPNSCAVCMRELNRTDATPARAWGERSRSFTGETSTRATPARAWCQTRGAKRVAFTGTKYRGGAPFAARLRARGVNSPL